MKETDGNLGYVIVDHEPVIFTDLKKEQKEVSQPKTSASTQDYFLSRLLKKIL
jgi:hypothetical protein